MNKDDVFAALDRLENDALASRDGYGDARKDAEIIRAALTAKQATANATIKSDNNETLYNALERIERLEAVNKQLFDALVELDQACISDFSFKYQGGTHEVVQQALAAAEKEGV